MQQFSVQAWPDGGSAEMTCSVHATKAEAEAEKRRQEAKRGDLWCFRVCEVVPEYGADTERELAGRAA